MYGSIKHPSITSQTAVHLHFSISPTLASLNHDGGLNCITEVVNITMMTNVKDLVLGPPFFLTADYPHFSSVCF